MIACVLLGLAGQPLWAAFDSRIVVWATWHDALLHDEPIDPWGNAFVEVEGELCSVGPNGALGDGDDVIVPRVPPGDLVPYRMLGWLPWILAITLALGWEAWRWLRRPRGGLRNELPVALVAGGVSGIAAACGLSVLASRERAVLRFLGDVAGGLVISPLLAFGGSVGLAVALAFLATRLRGGPEPNAPHGEVEGERRAGQDA
ncbi:MAG: hypothetical protein JKY65_04015 [Planctomycetes bacterium]|nr:hypothetical protein [Planctomycetota bacterium]